MLRMFLRTEVADRIGRLYTSRPGPTSEELRAFKADRAKRPNLAARVRARQALDQQYVLPTHAATTASSNEPDNYAVVGTTAQIAVVGVLSEEEDFWTWLLGLDSTTYADIRSSFALAGADPNVSSVQMLVGSPGGYVDGLFETLAIIEGFKKPITVEAVQACSAAYALAAMAGPIRATSPAAEFGSVGVAAEFVVIPEIVRIASTEAPKKRPDLTTEEGKAMVREELDAFHDLFVDAIARGRQHATGQAFDAARVNADFGRGGVLLTDKAKAAGMIDRAPRQVRRASALVEPTGVGASRTAVLDRLVSAAREPADEEPITPAPVGGPEPRQPAPAVTPPTPKAPVSTGQDKKTNMTKEELKAQFPAVYAAIFDEGKSAGVNDGQAAERKRVSAHLKASKNHVAKVTGVLKVALDAIQSGASLSDEEVQAEYMNAREVSSTQMARQGDSDAAGAALGDANAGSTPAAKPAKDIGDLTADALDEQLGRKPKPKNAA